MQTSERKTRCVDEVFLDLRVYNFKRADQGICKCEVVTLNEITEFVFEKKRI
jgi:hypothetical protein